MTYIIELVSFISIIVALIISLFFVVVYKSKISKIHSELVQTRVDKNYISEKLSNALLEIESKKIENTDGFLNFVSESRDWAFKYIEDVQEAHRAFDSKIEAVFEWADTYGYANGDDKYTEAINEISKAYEEFKKLMPEDNQTPNN